jgi:hypothetical protein
MGYVKKSIYGFLWCWFCTQSILLQIEMAQYRTAYHSHIEFYLNCPKGLC